MSRQFDYSKVSKNDLNRRRTSQFIANLGITVGFGFNSLINGWDKTPCFEFLHLSCIRPIQNGAMRSCHIAHEEVKPENARCLFLI